MNSRADNGTGRNPRRKSNFGRNLLAIIVQAILVFSLTVHDGTADTFRLLRVGDVKIPFYPPEGGRPIAIVHIGKISREYQRKGFFHIGILPIFVGDHVTVEVADERKFTGALLAKDVDLVGPLKSKPTRLRQVTFYFAGDVRPRLRADAAKIDSDGTWLLTGNVVIAVGSDSIQTGRARLTVNGLGAGRLQFESSGKSKTLSLFLEKSPKTISE